MTPEEREPEFGLASDALLDRLEAENRHIATMVANTILGLVASVRWLRGALAEEREACAKVAEGLMYPAEFPNYDGGFVSACEEIAAAILKRGA